MIIADTSELDVLAAAYREIPRRTWAEALPVLARGALNVKRGAVSILSGSITGTYLPHYPRSISYDIESGSDWAEAEIGPDPGMPQGGMGDGVECGSANTRPIPHLIPAWEQEIPRFDAQVGMALARGLP